MALLLSSVAAVSLLGQSLYGGLRGLVRDPDGRVVASVKILLVDEVWSGSHTPVAKVSTTSTK
jgi:hypothetical protein